MQKLIIFSLFLFLNSFSIFSQTEKAVFMVDARIDRTKPLFSFQGIRVFPDPKTPKGFVTPEYTIKNNRIEISQDRKKRVILQIDLRKKALFFTGESNNGTALTGEVIFDPNNPGEFMDLEGETIIPSNVSLPLSFNFPNPVNNTQQNKAVIDKNTVANSTLDDVNTAKDRITESVAIQNSKFGIGIEIISFNFDNISAFIIDYNFELNDNFGKRAFDNQGKFNNFKITIRQSASRPVGRGEAITNAQCVAKNIINMLIQCKSGSKPSFFGSSDLNELREVLTPILSAGCDIKPSFSLIAFGSNDNQGSFFIDENFLSTKNLFFK